MQWLINIAITCAALVGMEAFAWFAHKYIMHGWGWGWHQSHHQPRQGLFEKNDLYTLVFSLLVIGLFAYGVRHLPALFYVALGISLYGLLYALFHDGLVHRRWPVRLRPRGYLRTLVKAHHLHHATHGREGAVAFGFLWVRDYRALLDEFRSNQRGNLAPAGGKQQSGLDTSCLNHIKK